MLVTTPASPDGVTVHRYAAGQVYGVDSDPPMPADLAAVFVREGWGEAIEDAANRKRSESQKGIPKADKKRAGTSSAITFHVTRTAKASASGTNRGAAEEPSRVQVHAPARAPAREAPAGPGPECDWCEAPYTARKGRGGPVQRFCSDACRAAFHRAGRRWLARELEAGRLNIADLREFGPP